MGQARDGSAPTHVLPFLDIPFNWKGNVCVYATGVRSSELRPFSAGCKQSRAKQQREHFFHKGQSEPMVRCVNSKQQLSRASRSYSGNLGAAESWSARDAAERSRRFDVRKCEASSNARFPN